MSIESRKKSSDINYLPVVIKKLVRIKSGFWLLLVLLGIFLLRVPSLFEPYWYGDEGIYLILGQMMQRGAVLYRDIWDNKPPLLYLFYAISPTLIWAKLIASIFVLGTVVGVYVLGKKVFINTSIRFNLSFSLVAAVLTGILLSIPTLEGTIANAELFFTTLVVWGAYLMVTVRGIKRDLHKLLLVGFLASAAFLIKVPAIFDFMGMFLFLAAYLGEIFWSKEKWRDLIMVEIRTFLPIAAAFLLPIVLVLTYFYLNLAVIDFLTASFFQNASYVAVDSGPFSKLENPLFVKGLVLVVSVLLLTASYIKKLISKELFFLTLWFGFSLYGGLLSNRPYMHYLLQIVPPGVVLLMYVILNLKRCWIFLIPLFLMFYSLMVMFKGAFALPAKVYYENFFEFISERRLWEDYVAFFDKRTLNSYRISQYIKNNSLKEDPIFVWGDAAFVYVLSDRPVATRFIQAHHLTTIDPKNYDLVIERLNKVMPKLIIISRPGHFKFPMLEEFVQSYYHETAMFNDLHVFKKD